MARLLLPPSPLRPLTVFRLLLLHSIVAPFAIFAGISVTVTGHYKIQNHLGWAFLMVGLGLMSILKWNSSVAMWASLFVISFPSALPSADLSSM
jgi:hypothetical protein